MIDNKEFTLAEQKSKELMNLSIQGLRYFQTYDWLFLRGVITIGYIGWCIFCLEFVIKKYVLLKEKHTHISIKSGIMVMCGI
jgi:phosphatidylinositol glycan class N